LGAKPTHFGLVCNFDKFGCFCTTKSEKVLIVLMENDKNCTTKHVRQFWEQNQLILGWLASLTSLESFGTTKSEKVLNVIYLGHTDGK